MISKTSNKREINDYKRTKEVRIYKMGIVVTSSFVKNN